MTCHKFRVGAAVVVLADCSSRGSRSSGKYDACVRDYHDIHDSRSIIVDDMCDRWL
jgi:hypothetical protein